MDGDKHDRIRGKEISQAEVDLLSNVAVRWDYKSYTIVSPVPQCGWSRAPRVSMLLASPNFVNDLEAPTPLLP